MVVNKSTGQQSARFVYTEHFLGKGFEARAESYIQIKTEKGQSLFGAGIDTNIELASIKAIVSALNRAVTKR